MPLEPRVSRIVRIAGRLDRGAGARPIAEARNDAIVQARLARWLVMDAGPTLAEEHDIEVPVDGGRITVRLYRPHGPGPFPLYVFLHGGGWCFGTLTERDPRCRQVAARARCVVASVDYRLAPENAYPTAAEDGYGALTWLVERAADFDLDPDRVAVGGESAGANLAAALCLMARDRSGPAICHQWLDVPAVDARLISASMSDVPDGLLLDFASIVAFRDAYFQDADRMLEPYGSPLLADSHEDLPSAWIMTAEFDKLRDDGAAYADALRGGGVPVRHEVLEGHVHSSFAFTRLLPSARAYEERAIRALALALGT